MDPPPNSDDNTTIGPKHSIEESVERGIKLVTCTHRGNNKHQASVCIICDRFIIGIEILHKLSKERILEKSHRLSVETYQEFYDGEDLNPNLVREYHGVGLSGLLLSPRAYRDGDTFECCSQCFSSLKPSKAQVSKNPPKFAIANGFAIGYIS